MVQYDRIILLLLAIIITVPVIVKSRQSSVSAALTAFSVSSSSRGYVCVSGDVRHPGIYPISANMLTTDAIRMAKPLQPAISPVPDGWQSVYVRNGTDIRVSGNSGSASTVLLGTLSTAKRIVLGIPLDINAMTAEDFDRIPGVGPVLARRIIEYRQLNGGARGVNELIYVEGIGEKKYINLNKFFN